MNNAVKHIVIVGGGTAGWLTAGVIAAEHHSKSGDGIKVTLIESPDIKIVGVGEGTWPTLRNTLKKIGIRETDFFRECDASFKQGAQFVKWATGNDDDSYYHPLVIPEGYLNTDYIPYWEQVRNSKSFASTVTFQGHLCDAGKAPKQISTPEYAAVANYAYHLDAGKFSKMLTKHCCENLGVKHIKANVISVNSTETGDIASVKTVEKGDIEGDLFVDCTGFSSLLLGKHYQIPFIDKKHILFNDCALAVHAPYKNENDPIASHTISTAHDTGWFWDIGLPTRRGVGCVYSSEYCSDEQAESKLLEYLQASVDPQIIKQLSPRKLNIRPGHRQKFWHKNCVAVGLAAGFLEPLEASAIVLIELSASMISEQLPANREVMEVASKRFNKRFLYRWDRIIDFLKLHYAISRRRDSQYWIDNVSNHTIPIELQELIKLWRHQPPSRHDFTDAEEVFPSASYQYVLYGMGFKTEMIGCAREGESVNDAKVWVQQTAELTQKFLKALPSNRELISKIHSVGMQRI